MYNHILLPVLPQLEQITELDGKRHYKTTSGLLLPSVTTVLAKADPNKNATLRGWRNYIGDEKANAILENSRLRGTILDKMVEDHLNNISVTINQDEAGDMFMALIPYLQHINNIHFLQPMLHSERLGVAGSADIIADFQNICSVIDIKNARKTRTEDQIWTYFLQTTAYGLMYNEYRQQNIVKQIVILMAVENKKPQIFIKKMDPYVKPLLQVIKKYNNSQKL